MKNKIGVFVIISIFLLISSCVEVSQNIYLNDNSSGKMELNVIMPVEFKNEIGNHIKQKLSFLIKKKNCKVIEKDNLETKKHILTLIYNFKNINEINKSLLTEYKFSKQGFLIKKYSIVFKYMPEDSESKIGGKVKELVSKKVPVTVTITLPGKVKDFSNNLTLNNSNTLIFKTNYNTLISSSGAFKAQSSNIMPLIIFIICVIIILGIIFLIKYFIPAKKQEEEQETEEPVISENTAAESDEAESNNEKDDNEIANEKKGDNILD